MGTPTSEITMVKSLQGSKKANASSPQSHGISLTILNGEFVCAAVLALFHQLPDEPLMKLNYDASKKEWRKWQSARKAELDDTASEAKRNRGVNYYKVLTVASNGDKQALAQFFSFGEFMGGATAEPGGYYTQAWELFHVVGDKNFSNFVRGLPVTDQIG